MGQAREIMDRITAAVMAGDREALRQSYAPDAEGETPDAPRLSGAEAMADYLLGFTRAFPDASFESTAKHEAGNTAIDEGYFVGTHTGVLSAPEGDIEPTGRTLRLRECDVLTVANGLAVAHRFYYDQLDLLTQLGLTSSDTGAGTVPQPRAGADRPSQVGTAEPPR
ncbi:ester cyclase [Modestobacter sp. I12A-02662]|uniref:ester cyclase n=1 Tax=Modestobacter sp. I12A-02662 TaxID=1730496 RepID=UPI0034DFB7D8